MGTIFLWKRAFITVLRKDIHRKKYFWMVEKVCTCHGVVKKQVCTCPAAVNSRPSRAPIAGSEQRTAEAA